MKRILLPVLTVLLFLFAPMYALAQGSTSNKGTEFWTCYMDHINGATGNNASSMILYITSDVSTTGSVSFADGTASMPFTVNSNTVTFVTIPASQFLASEGTFTKGIHITSVKPIAVYAHIYASSVSGATLLLPVNTMGKDYYSINYRQLSNNNPSYSTFSVIATEDNTTVEITPTTLLTSGHVAGTPFQITLNKGQLYQGLAVNDLTGTRIRSISNASGACKKIAVFSGSSKIGIGLYDATKSITAQSLSSDNLFQQVYPTSTWGKNYITVSLKNRNYDIYRIVLSDPITTVTLNGSIVPANAFVNNLYYEFPTKGLTTNIISADKPIQVVQYTATQSEGLNAQLVNVGKVTPAESAGDPEMIYLPPIEQGLDHVTLYSTGYFDIANAFINVVIPTAAASSFTIDGKPGTVFTPIAGSTYSYAQIATTQGPNAPGATNNYGGTSTSGTHNIKASQPFTAIAYGFGGTESYGYAAGTNLINLNEFVQLQNTSDRTIPPTNAGCTNVPYALQLTVPYQTTKITWDFKDGTTPLADNAPVPYATTVKNGVTLYSYACAKTVNYTTPGSYTVVAIVFNPLASDCGSNEDIEFDFTTTDLPAATFTKTDNCLGTPTVFTDTSDPKTSVLKSWLWDFGDGTTSIQQNPTHTYATPGDYNVALTAVNENGCSSTSAIQKVHITALPQAAFSFPGPGCEGQNVVFTDKSTPVEGAITNWVWDFGDGTAPVTKTDNLPVIHVYTKAGSYPVTLKVTSAGGCINTSAAQMVLVNPLPLPDFALPGICLVNAAAQFTDATKNTTGKALTYQWDFGDANATSANPNTAAVANPTHQFSAAGTYHVAMTIVTADGCSNTITKDYVVTGVAKFTAPATACPNDVVTFTDQTDPSNKAVTVWNWVFDDGATSNQQNPQHAFTTSGDHLVILNVVGNNGCSTTTYSQKIHITASPKALFTYSATDCATKAITFTDGSTSAESPVVSWLWDFGDGSAPQTLATNTALTHTYTAAGSYTVSLQVTTASGCASTLYRQTVVVHPLPIVDFTLPDACLQDSPQFMSTGLSSIADHTESEFTYLWDFGDPKASAANNISTLANPTHHYTDERDDTNPYIITLTITSKYGCSVTTTHPFTVNGASPVAAFAKDPANTYCSSDDVAFTNLAHVSFGKITQIKMYWDYNGDRNNFTVYTKDQINTPGFKLMHNYGLFSAVGQTKNYAVSMVAYSGSSASCADQNLNPVTITIQNNPTVTLSTIGTICQEASPVQITENKNGFTGTGVFSGTGVSPTGLFNPAKAGPGTFTVNYLFTAANGCIYATTQQVTVTPTPKSFAGTDQTLLEGGSLNLAGKASGIAPLTYKWTMQGGGKAVKLDHDDILNPVASPTDNVTYALTVTSADGCTATSLVNVTVLKAPVVPNTFTPNGDGVNDKWDIKYLETYPNATIEVFNRQGTRLYSSNGYPVPWDGTFNGVDLPVGTYYYIINPRNGRKTISGSVTIVR